MINKIIEELKNELEQTESLLEIEKSPLGGNRIKEAEFQGEVIGIKKALLIIDEFKGGDINE